MMSRRSIAAGMGFLFGFSSPMLQAQPCPIVDRGSPLDGITTITVIQRESDCADDPLFTGWRCMTLQSNANDDNGMHYNIDVRWNRVGQPVRGSFTWLKGGNGTVSIRATAPLAQQMQDTLDTVDEVRTIELRFLGQGMGTAPRNGFPNISSVYADVLEWLVTNGIAEGVIGHYGNSGGGMMGANALSYHQLDQVLDGIVLGGSPFFTDLFLTCTDPRSPIFAPAAMRSIIDQWNWLELGGASFCFDMSPQSEPPYECRSTLGIEADTEYPEVMVSVIIGINDNNNPWIDAAAMDYWKNITAQSKTFDRPDAPHFVVLTQDGADAVYQRIVEIVNVQDTCPGDIDGDGDVDVTDLLAVLAAWGPCPPKGDCPADFDDSGDVGVKDLLVLLGNWGPCP